jgi:hypothetical protein
VLAVLEAVLAMVRRVQLLVLLEAQLYLQLVVGMVVVVPPLVREALAVVAGTLQAVGLVLLDKALLVAVGRRRGQLMVQEVEVVLVL